MARLMPFNDRN